MKRLLVAALAAIGGVHSQSHAQAPITLSDNPACASCMVQFDPVVSLGHIDDPAGFGSTVQVAMNSRGQLIASSPTFSGEVFLYNSDGTFERVVGRRGQGPGEFMGTQLLAFDAQDTLYTVQVGRGRVNVFAPDFTFVRSFQLMARTLAARVEKSRSLFVVGPTTEGTSTFVLQVFSMSGEHILAFDSVQPGFGPAQAGRRIAIDTMGNRWSIGAGEYRITEWDENGRISRQFEATRHWIGGALPMRLDRDEKPPGQIGGIEFDTLGLLWIFAAVPDANWRPTRADERVDPNTMFDTIVEVIDPTIGRLVARRRMRDLVLPFSPGMGYSIVQDDNSDSRVTIWRFSLATSADRSAR